MLELGKHFFIFAYIAAFFQGIILLTLNQIYIIKTQDGCYRKLQYFNWAFFIHIAINFIYFYGLYFWIAWKVRDVILFAVNMSFFVFIYCAMEMLQGFCQVKMPYGRHAIVASGLAYVFIYSLTYKDVINPLQAAQWNLQTLLFVLSDVLFVCVVAFCCERLIHGISVSEMVTRVKLMRGYCISILAYAVFNLYVDICFCFFYEKTNLWNINMYNLTIIFYLFLNFLSIPLFYNRERFIKAITGQEGGKDVRIEEVEVIVLSSTAAESADVYHLSAREKEVLELVCQGKTNPDISQILFISNNTVKHHIYSIYKKMGVKNRYELLAMVKK